MKKRTSSGMLLALLAITAGCTSGGGQAGAKVQQMGERVQVGPLAYDVLEIEWHPMLGGQQPKSTENRFAALRLSITNSGRQEVRLPLLQMVDDKGSSTMELTEVKGLEEWLGVFRTLKANETLQGRIAFELKPQDYRLRVTDAGEPEAEKTALVAIPLRFSSREPASTLPEPEAMAPSKQ
jgi:hypothetical protein